jgi:hypothetical protein
MVTSDDRNEKLSERAKETLVVGGLIVLALAGCGQEVEPLGMGSLALEWEVSPRGCLLADVDQVLMELKNERRHYVEVFDCERGQAFVDELSAGNYSLDVYGLDPSGRAIFAAPSRTLTIRSEVLNRTETLRLTARPATLDVEWVFDNGRVCGSNDVDVVEIAVFDESDFEMARHRFSCNDGEGRVPGLAAGSFLVEAAGLSRGQVTYRGTVIVALKRGDESRTEIVLETAR